MRIVYVEALPKGLPEGSVITDFVVLDRDDHILHFFSTQSDALSWARANGHHALIARVRHLNDKRKPNNWRVA